MNADFRLASFGGEPPELSVVVPFYNEEENIREVYRRLTLYSGTWSDVTSWSSSMTEAETQRLNC